MPEELVNVSDINQYVYCPRRYWYLHYQDTQGQNYQRTHGTALHDAQSTRGEWLNELYLESTALGLKGKIDVYDRTDDTPVPVERKRASSGDYYQSDELQLAGYCLLLEQHLDERIDQGAIYLYETDQRMHIPITDAHRQHVHDIVDAIQAMTADDIPPFVDNTAKCEACSTREYCLPEETALLEPDKVAGTGWEDHV